MFNGVNPFTNNEKGQSKVDDIPFYFIGFKSATPKLTLGTHIWALLHTQILYRTVSGMMNYSRAIKLLFCVDNPEVVQQFGSDTDKLERELKQMVRHKFKFVVLMQWFSKFNKEEHENAEFWLCAYSDFQIAYLEEELLRKEQGNPRIFCHLSMGTASLYPRLDVGGPSSILSFLGTRFLRMGSWITRTCDYLLAWGVPPAC